MTRSIRWALAIAVLWVARVVALALAGDAVVE
jgi:hypothetical protein